MKAVVVTPYYLPKLGGLEVYAHQLNLGLQSRKDWEVVVVTSNHEGHHTVVDTVDGLTVIRLGQWFKFSNTPLNPLWPLLLRLIFKREQPDIIIAHTPVPSLADAARLAAGKTPLMVFYHAATLLKGNSLVFDTIARLYQRYERGLLRRANVICAVSEFVKQQFPAHLQAKTVVVPNAVWQEQIVTRRQPLAPNILFIGSLDRSHAWKGLELVIKAIAQVRQRYGDNMTLTVMSDGNHRRSYEQLAESLGIGEAVTFLGNQIGQPKEEAFRRAMGLVVYPVSANDAFPTVMLEAWARSVPVVAATIGPLPSLIDEHTGYLVPPCDVSALAATLHRFAHTSSTARQLVADEARKRTAQQYTWELQATVVDKLAKELR